MDDEILYVLAGNIHEFRDFVAKQRISQRRAIYLDSETQLLGVNCPTVAMVGTYFNDRQLELHDSLTLRGATFIVEPFAIDDLLPWRHNA